VTAVMTAEHRQVAGWGGVRGECGVECACGVTYDRFDTIAGASALLALHIARPEPVAMTEHCWCCTEGEACVCDDDGEACPCGLVLQVDEPDLTWRDVLAALACSLLARVVGDRRALAVHAFLRNRRGGVR
jgi:hypothetical protein